MNFTDFTPGMCYFSSKKKKREREKRERAKRGHKGRRKAENKVRITQKEKSPQPNRATLPLACCLQRSWPIAVLLWEIETCPSSCYLSLQSAALSAITCIIIFLAIPAIRGLPNWNCYFETHTHTYACKHNS